MRLTRAEITHKRQHAAERQRDFPHIHNLSPIHYYVTLNKLFNIFKTLSCPTLCDPMDYTVHGILQARMLEWIAFLFSRGSSQPRSLHCRQILYQLSHKGSPKILEWVASPFSSRSSRPRNRTRVSCIAGGFFTNWAMREALKRVI